VTAREVDPYKLVYKDGFWYLVAFCHQREKVRIFRVDRIHRLAITTKHFTITDHFDYEEYMGSAWQMERGEEFYFKVRFFKDTARYVKETHFHPSQEISEKQGGTLLFSARASGISSILRWVLSFGAEAEVLEPPELRAMVAKIMVEGAKRYKAEPKQSKKVEQQRVGLSMKFWDNPIDEAVWNRD
jgi:predicted DNA-binding transcriptional regulator YafY